MSTYSDKALALKAALKSRDLFYTGICAIPEYQRFLYYTDSGVHRRIDFTNAGPDDLKTLYDACKPAEFGRNGENVFDESYRKARKMDPTSFATLLDPRSLDIQEKISRSLLVNNHTSMVMELYKLNVYGKGDFFKAHKDTPRGHNMFGSLVVVLPTAHEGGQFVLRQSKEWTIDFTEKFAAATEPSICFIAFYGDIEHEVLPITSGSRVTLTYNLYHKPTHPATSSIPTPFHLTLRQALTDLVNDPTALPDGGYLGFGLIHKYVFSGLGQLKGSDRALADVCDELGLCYCIRLLYRDILNDGDINLITTRELDPDCDVPYDDHISLGDYLPSALDRLTREEVEGVSFVGSSCEPDFERYEFLEDFYETPITEVLEITPMESTVNVREPVLTYGNEAGLEYFYGTACMLISVDPAKSRQI